MTTGEEIEDIQPNLSRGERETTVGVAVLSAPSTQDKGVLGAEAIGDGLASQYAEVEWVRGVQERRQLGLEPPDEDPYAHVPSRQLQPSVAFLLQTERPSNSAARDSLFSPQAASVSLSFGRADNSGDLEAPQQQHHHPWPRLLRGDETTQDERDLNVSSSAENHHKEQHEQHPQQLYSQRLADFEYRWPNPLRKEVHFVHVPKCGGTSVTRVLRRMACQLHNGTADTLNCCARPGFCGAPEKRLCSLVKGCVNHLPLLKAAFRPLQRPSLTILRWSLHRVVSSWHYRCHNPNFDCYKVRPGLRTWKMHLSGKPTPPGYVNFTFREFLDMPEFHNIATRMLAYDVEPYGGRKVSGADKVVTQPARGVVLTQRDLTKASRVLDAFAWVGLMELMGTSLLLLSARLGAPLERSDFVRQRATHTPLYRSFVKALSPSSSSSPFSPSLLSASASSSASSRPSSSSESSRSPSTTTAAATSTAAAAVNHRQVQRAILAANAFDVELWRQARARQCSELAHLGLLRHPVVVTDLALSKVGPCEDSLGSGEGSVVVGQLRAES